LEHEAYLQDEDEHDIAEVDRGLAEDAKSWGISSDTDSTTSWADIASSQSDESWIVPPHVTSTSILLASSGSSNTDRPDSSGLSEETLVSNFGATRWYLAVARAEMMAELYFATHKFCSILQHYVPACTASPESTMSPGRPKKFVASGQSIAARLRLHFDVYTSKASLPKRQTQFDRFRTDFLEQHGMDFCERLRQVFGGPMSLKTTPLSNEVVSRFLDVWHRTPSDMVKPAFHGTSPDNLQSIYKIGLVIPGQDNHIRVANGQAHGRGIYTATVSNPILSWGFARGPSRPILVCAVLDDAQRLDESERIGMLSVTAQSPNIRHVGNAMVVFDAARVAPLYVVTVRNSNVHGGPPKKVITATANMLPRKKARKTRKPFSDVDSTGAVAFLSRRAARKYRRG
jgi:hypothetical protein